MDHDSRNFFLEILLDEAMSAFERMQKRQSTPHYAKKVLKAKDRPFNTGLGPEIGKQGWDDLVSLAAGADKGLIHQFVDGNYKLQKLYAKVSPSLLYVQPAIYPPPSITHGEASNTALL